MKCTNKNCCGACESLCAEEENLIKDTELVTFEASYRCESEKSISALYQKTSPDGSSWMSAEWFPKKICTFSERKPYGRFNITAPLWLLKRMKIEDLVTRVPPVSLMGNIISEYITKVSKERDEFLKKHLIEKLNKMGFLFGTDQDFLDFVSARITRISFLERPDYYEIWLDRASLKNRATNLIAAYEEVTETGKVTAGTITVNTTLKFHS